MEENNGQKRRRPQRGRLPVSLPGISALQYALILSLAPPCPCSLDDLTIDHKYPFGKVRVSRDQHQGNTRQIPNRAIF